MANTEVNLQRVLDLFHDWFKKFVMTINREKTQIVQFRRAKIPCMEFQFSIGKDNLTVTSKYKYNVHVSWMYSQRNIRFYYYCRCSV